MADKSNGFICSAKGKRVVINNAAPDGKKAVKVGSVANLIVPVVVTDAIKDAQTNGRIKIFKNRKDAENFLSPKTKNKTEEKKSPKNQEKKSETPKTAPATPPAQGGQGGSKTGDEDTSSIV